MHPYVMDESGRRIPVIAGGADEPKPEEKPATMAEIMGALRKEFISPLMTKIDALTEENKTTKTQVVELSAALKKAVEADTAEDDESDDEGPAPKAAKADNAPDMSVDDGKPLTKRDLDKIVRFSTKKLASQVEALTKTVADERKARAEADVRAREAVKDQVMTQALNKAKVVDLGAAKTIMGQRVKWDEAKDQYVYTAPEGVEIPLVEFNSDEGGFEKFSQAIEQDIPPYLRPSATNQGGSGSSVPKSVAARKDAELRLEAAKKRSKDDPRSDAAAAELLTAQREMQALAQVPAR